MWKKQLQEMQSIINKNQTVDKNQIIDVYQIKIPQHSHINLMWYYYRGNHVPLPFIERKWYQKIMKFELKFCRILTLDQWNSLPKYGD